MIFHKKYCNLYWHDSETYNQPLGGSNWNDSSNSPFDLDPSAGLDVNYDVNGSGLNSIRIFLNDQDVGGSAGIACFNRQRTLIKAGSNSINGGEDPNWLNSIIIHEIGHVLQLYHTHESSPHVCSEQLLIDNLDYAEKVSDFNQPSGYLNGDKVIDTPADPGLREQDTCFNQNVNISTAPGCVYSTNNPVLDSDGAPYNPLPSNFMGYADPCRSAFTPGQVRIMKGSYELGIVAGPSAPVKLLEVAAGEDFVLSDVNWTYLDEEDLVIRSGGKLQITSGALEFSANGKIVIEKGGELILGPDDYSDPTQKVTLGIGGCDTNSDLWSGICVEGDDDYSQPYTPGYGKLTITRAEISGAAVAIRNYLLDDTGDPIFESAGGIVNISSTQFGSDGISPGGNVMDVHFLPYLAYPISTIPGFGPSQQNVFYNCAFLIDELSSSNLDLNTLQSRLHIVGNPGVRFTDCQFIDSRDLIIFYPFPLSDKPTAIWSVNSNMVINSCLSDCQPKPSDFVMDGSLIRGFNYGILQWSYLDNTYTTMEDVTFSNNLHGVETYGIRNFTFKDNEIDIPTLSPLEIRLDTMGIDTTYIERDAYGLFLGYSSGYEVTGNSFNTNVDPSLPPDSVSPTSGIIIANDYQPVASQIYYNSFNDLQHGTLIMGKNRDQDLGSGTYGIGFEALCGTYTKSASNQLTTYDIALTNHGTAAINQGLAWDPVFEDPESAAGNRFSALGSPCTGNEASLWVNDEWVTTPEDQTNAFFNYHHHSNLSQSPQDGCFTELYVNPLSSLTLQNFDDICPAPVQLSGEDWEVEAEDSRTEREELNDTAEGLIDGGDTEALVQLVTAHNSSTHSLRASLLNASPYLSDEVLASTIEHGAQLNSWHFTEVMLANSPLSEAILTQVDQEAAYMPDFLFNFLLAHQSEGLSPRGNLEAQLYGVSRREQEAEQAYSRRHLLEVGSAAYQDILDFYELEQDNESIRQRVTAYMGQGKYNDARSALSLYQENGLDEYSLVESIIIDIQEFGSSQAAGDLGTLQSIAQSGTQASMKAQLLLWELTGQKVSPLPIEYPMPSFKSLGVEKISYRKVDPTDLLAVLPNPSEGLFQLVPSPDLLALPSITVEIIDINGKQTDQFQLSSTFDIDLRTQANGIYVLRLTLDNISLGQVKLVKQ